MSPVTHLHLPGSVKDRDLSLLRAVSARLERAKTEVEFYFLGGAVLYQAFNADPKTAHVGSMLRPASVVRDAARDVAAREGVPEDWLPWSVRRVLSGEVAGAGTYLELRHLRAFVPLPGYVLAVKCAAMRLGEDFRETEDVRYVLRAMNLTSADEALSVVLRYFTDRQLVPDTRLRLERLLQG